jgi:hypothetical protein
MTMMMKMMDDKINDDEYGRRTDLTDRNMMDDELIDKNNVRRSFVKWDT